MGLKMLQSHYYEAIFDEDSRYYSPSLGKK